MRKKSTINFCSSFFSQIENKAFESQKKQNKQKNGETIISYYKLGVFKFRISRTDCVHGLHIGAPNMIQ